ncbi:MAG: Endonuclease/Exonuclease/phosphatase family protein [Phycisphaerales bacterium]|nr:Endonuclease/Exonuclease/phosphatase family protein [Phycisphaerales bacterium]
MPVLKPFRGLVVCAALAALASPLFGALRIATYNVAADTDRNNDGTLNVADSDFVVPKTVAAIQAMAGRSLAGNAQPLDVLSLQELYDSSTTTTPITSATLTSIVNSLNTIYGAGTYAYDPLVGDTTGQGTLLTGNGPNGLIYNTKTVAVLASSRIGTPSGSGIARTPMRYTLQALNTTGANTFYLYNQHAKASSGTANTDRRNYEADAVRADADALGSTAHIIFTGDLNLTGGSAEAAYQDMLAAPGTTLATNGNPSSGAANLVAGPSRGFDPLASTFTTSNSAYLKYYSESSTSLTARFDFQLLTANTLPGAAAAGLQLVANTYTAFGNSYYNASNILSSVNSVSGSVNNATNYNTAATGYTQAMLANLTASSDHLPVVADYVIAVPEPGTTTLMFAVAWFAVRRRRCLALPQS